MSIAARNYSAPVFTPQKTGSEILGQGEVYQIAKEVCNNNALLSAIPHDFKQRLRICCKRICSSSLCYELGALFWKKATRLRISFLEGRSQLFEEGVSKSWGIAALL